MDVQDLALDIDNSNNNSREELFVMPVNKEFEELSQKEKYTLNKDGTLTLKNKLVMREGTHNGVYYSWEELKDNYLTGEGAGLFYDHDDCVKNYTGLVKNLKANEATKEILGDVHVTDKQAALNISLGAKWGISPTIEAEKLLRDGKKYAVDPLFLSYSLVLRPAVRETMLNSDNGDSAIRRSNNLEKNSRDKKLLATKENKIQELEDEVAGLKSKVEESEQKEIDNESEELCSMEQSIGFTSEADANSRLEELKSLSAESRLTLKATHEKYAKTLKLGEEEEDDNGESTAEELKENFLVFRAKYLKKNPKATKAEIKAAFAKLAAIPVKKYPYPEAKSEGNLNEANAQNRMKAELAEENNRQSKINSNILAYMKERK